MEFIKPLSCYNLPNFLNLTCLSHTKNSFLTSCIDVNIGIIHLSQYTLIALTFNLSFDFIENFQMLFLWKMKKIFKLKKNVKKGVLLLLLLADLRYKKNIIDGKFNKWLSAQYEIFSLCTVFLSFRSTHFQFKA